MAVRMQKPFAQRRSGVLLHVGSLPSGDFGPDAYHFINFLADSGFGIWQVLPLNPPDKDNSPYIACAVQALNPDFISQHLLQEWSWLPEKFVGSRNDLLGSARQYFHAHALDEDKKRYVDFLEAQKDWLNDYALYIVLEEKFNNTPWYEWDRPLRDRQEDVLREARSKHAERIDEIRFEQFVANRQWQVLHEYAHTRGIQIFGDLPIFVSLDSVDVWVQRKYFKLDKQGQPYVVAGVPPDYFSETGQRWGNPLYDWKNMQEADFDWWISRMRRQLELFDIVRMDHFRGFEAYWEIDANSDSAVEGKWIKAPGDELFATLKKHFGPLPLVAEDLGDITEEVLRLRRKYLLPGMSIMQFGFDGEPDNPHLPHNFEHDNVVYSGTHDNNTTLGWYHDLDSRTKRLVNSYFACTGSDMPWPVIHAVLSSVAQTAIVTMQDLLALGSDTRMNMPGVKRGNWSWKFDWQQVPADLASRMLEMNSQYSRNHGL